MNSRSFDDLVRSYLRVLEESGLLELELAVECSRPNRQRMSACAHALAPPLGSGNAVSEGFGVWWSCVLWDQLYVVCLVSGFCYFFYFPLLRQIGLSSGLIYK